MKKIILSLATFSLIFFAACKKDNVMANTENDSDEYEYVDDTEDDSNAFVDATENNDPDERGVSPFLISSLSFTDNVDASFIDGCTSSKLIGRAMLNQGTLHIIGKGFGATRDSSQVQIYNLKDRSTQYAQQYVEWSDTLVRVNVGENTEGLKTFTIRVQITNPKVPKDSTKSSPSKFVSKTKSKTLKCVGVAPRGNVFGSMGWEIIIQRLANQKSPDYTTAAITSEYVPELGDVLEKGDGRRGVITAIAANEITIWQRNTNCKSNLKKGKWLYNSGVFTAKKDETGGTWVKFAH